MKSELSGCHLYAHMLDYYPYAVSMQWNLWVEVEKNEPLQTATCSKCKVTVVYWLE